MQHGEDLGDDAAHRRAHGVGGLDAGGVEDRHRVLSHLRKVVGAFGLVGVADTPIVEGDAAVVLGERPPLADPAS